MTLLLWFCASELWLNQQRDVGRTKGRDNLMIASVRSGDLTHPKRRSGCFFILFLMLPNPADVCRSFSTCGRPLAQCVWRLPAGEFDNNKVAEALRLEHLPPWASRCSGDHTMGACWATTNMPLHMLQALVAASNGTMTSSAPELSRLGLASAEPSTCLCGTETSLPVTTERTSFPEPMVSGHLSTSLGGLESPGQGMWYDEVERLQQR